MSTEDGVNVSEVAIVAANCARGRPMTKKQPLQNLQRFSQDKNDCGDGITRE
jgi:hypothetical protein